MSIGQNLKILREEKSLSQQALADNVGITQSMICQLEQDRKVLTLPLANEIAKVLGCSLNDFIP